jgi:RimJ/RimL family protein N-acetyltransferase
MPTIETERLRLRMFRPDDLDDLATMFADPEVVK